MTRKTIYRKAISDYFGDHPGKDTWRKVYSVLSGGTEILTEDEQHAVFCIKADLSDSIYRDNLRSV